MKSSAFHDRPWQRSSRPAKGRPEHKSSSPRSYRWKPRPIPGRSRRCVSPVRTTRPRCNPAPPCLTAASWRRLSRIRLLQQGVGDLQQVVDGSDRAELAGPGGRTKVGLGVVDRVILAVDRPDSRGGGGSSVVAMPCHHPAEATLELADQVGLTRGEPLDQGGRRLRLKFRDSSVLSQSFISSRSARDHRPPFR